MSGGFLSRWARLKAETQALEKPPAPEPLPEDPAAAAPPAVVEDGAAPEDQGAAAEEEAFDLASLPDVDSLTAESDYSVFMDARVPGEVRNRALRKLWTSDPVYAVRDGLNDYDEDFGAASLAGQVVKSAWDALHGYRFPEDEETAKEAVAEGAPDEGTTEAPPPESTAPTESTDPARLQVEVEKVQDGCTDRDGETVRYSGNT